MNIRYPNDLVILKVIEYDDFKDSNEITFKSNKNSYFASNEVHIFCNKYNCLYHNKS